MDKKFLDLLKSEDEKNPLTDDQIAALLSISRQGAIRLRAKHQIDTYNKRREASLYRDVLEILDRDPDISDRELTRVLQDKGYEISKFLAVSVRKACQAEKANRESDAAYLLPEADEPSAAPDMIDSMIGAKGSIQNQLRKAKAAVLYPPNGLHTLIVGETGTGKTLLAEAMHQLAYARGISKKEKLIQFNCADYYNNPQLLVSHLFGHVKGAFTGADHEKNGLVESANHGILFLDEIHRLPLEGQEMLFSIIDKGSYRKLGESDKERQVSLMIIGATTEDVHSALALTFIRRMPMVIELPPIRNRDIGERYQIIEMFFKNESNRIGVGLHVSSEVICALLVYNCIGNIGQLRSDIQVACARAYIRFLDSQENYMRITLLDFDSNIQDELIRKKYSLRELGQYMDKSIKVLPGSQRVEIIAENDAFLMPNDIYDFIESRHEALAKENYSSAAIRETIGKELEFKIRKSVRNIKESGIDIERNTLIKITGPKLFKVVESMMDIARSEMENIHDDVLYYLALHFKQSYERIKLGKPILNPRISQIKEELEFEFSVARKMLDHAEKELGISFPEEEAGYIAIYLNVNSISQRDGAKVQLVLLSHGNVAFEMAKLINTIIGQDFVKAVCIQVEESSSFALEETLALSKEIDQGRGILYLADMGATARFGEAVEKELGISVRTVNYVTTAMALDAAFHIIYHDVTLEELYAKVSRSRESGSKPSDAPKPRVIITLCLTGKGAAQEIKRIITESIPEISSSEIKIVPLALMQNDFDAMIRMLQRENEVIGIVGTVDPQKKDIPFISMRNIFDEQGISALKAIIKRSNIYYEDNEENETPSNRIADLLFPELIFLDYKAESKEELLQFVSNILIEKGYVAEGFYQGLLEREKMGGNIFKNHVAFPHTWPEYTRKQAIVVCRLQKGIQWSKDSVVDLVFLLAFEIADKSVIRKLYNAVSSEEKNALLRSAQSKEDIVRLLIGP